MRDDEWFEGAGVEGQRLTVLPWLLFAVFALSMILAPLLLTGCAASFSGVCAVQAIGEDENGLQYYRYICRPS